VSGPAFRCAVAYLALELAEAVIQNSADALYLARHGASSLGFLLAASSALAAATVGVVGALADRGDRPRLLFRISLGAAALFGGAWLFGSTQVLLIVSKQTSTALDLAFWVVVADRFDARQARRLVPMFTAAGGAGMVLGSFGTPALAGWVGVRGLILVAAALTAAAAAVVRTLDSPPAPNAPAPLWNTWKEGAVAVRRSPLYARLGWVVAAAGMFGPILYTALGAAAAAEHRSAAELAAFYGQFRGVTSLLTLGAQAAVGPAFFHFFGVGNAFLLAPVAAAAAGVMLLIRPELAVVAAGQAVARVLDAAVQTPAERLVQNLAPPRLRGRVGAFLDGVAKRSGALAGGLLVGALAAPPLVLVVGIAWTVQALWLRRRFPALAVGELLASPAPRDTLAAVDEATLRLLRRDLVGRDEARRELALALLARGPDAVPLLVEGASAAPHARARLVAALDRILEADPTPRPTGLGEAVLALLHDGDPELQRANVVQAFGRLADPTAFGRGRARLVELAETDPSPAVRLAAGCALARWDGRPRHPVLAEAMIRGRDAASRIVLVEELRAELLAGGDPASLVGLAPTEPAALEALADARRGEPEVLEAARAALDGRGDSTRVRAAALRILDEPALWGRALGDPDETIRELAAASLRRAGPPALPVLLVTARFGSRRAREAALEVARDLPAPVSTWDDLIEAELDELRRLAERRGALAHLGASSVGHLVLLRLDERIAGVARTLLLVLEVRLRDPSIGAAASALAGESRGRARALEALDAVLPRALALRVLPALDAVPVGAAGDGEAAARAELMGSDLLTRTLLVAALGPTGRAAHRDVLRRAAVSAATSDPLRILRRIAQNGGEEESEDVPSLAETLVALRELAPFGELLPSELHELARRARWETRGAGETLGEDEALWAVVSGRVLVDGAERSLLGERALFGVGAAPRAVAAEPSRLLHLLRRDFEQAALEVPGIALAVARAIMRERHP